MANCTKCSMPIDEKTVCKCNSEVCCHCCECESDCDCGCKSGDCCKEEVKEEVKEQE